jgi:hypothetical protein
VTEMYAFTAMALTAASEAAGPDGQGRPTASAELRIVLEPVAVCLPSGATVVEVALGDVRTPCGDRPVSGG